MRFSCLFLLALWVTIPISAAPIDRAAREALVIVDLANAVAPERKQYYEVFETFALSESRSKLPAAYRQVTYLVDENATLENLGKTLERLSAQEGTKAIDLYVHLHGSPGGLTFHEGGYAMADIEAKLRNLGDARAKLRAVYSAACYGSTHEDSWLQAGFKVAGGAIGVNANTAYDLPAFLKTWNAGGTFQAAETRANEPRWLKFYDNIAIRMGMPDANSFKTVRGNGTVTIGGDPTQLEME